MNKEVGYDEFKFTPGVYNKGTLVETSQIGEKLGSIIQAEAKELGLNLDQSSQQVGQLVQEKVESELRPVNNFSRVVVGAGQVVSEMVGINQYSTELAKFISQDEKRNPLQPNEKTNLIGYSGGGQLAFNTAEKLKAYNIPISTVVTLGSPVVNAPKSNVKEIVHLFSEADGKVDGVWSLTTKNDSEPKIIYSKSIGIKHSNLSSYLDRSEVASDILKRIQKRK